jgi:hypothetical protein
MKTMIRIAASTLAVLFVGVSANCSPNPVAVYDVHNHRYYQNYDTARYSSSYYGNGYYTPSSSARAFEPVEGF